MNYTKELTEITQITNGFKPMKQLAEQLRAEESDEALTKLAYELYQAKEHQVRMVAVFLFGQLAAQSSEVLRFLQLTVAKDENWRVQEILAMAFDSFCKDTGYEESLPTIREWLKAENANTRRAVSEGLRIWTSRPYFKENPAVAISVLTQLRNDSSEYVRKSCGNALRDISKRFPEMILAELATWGDSKNELQVEKLIMKNKKLSSPGEVGG